jgi:glycosyltransferase involved in cell wall biosynthesis
MKKQTTKLSIVIPALNEEEGIGAAIDQIPVRELKKLGYEVEILVVDNASTDNTAEVALAHGAKVVYQPVRGYGNAYKAGFAAAQGEIIATGDADMTYPFDALPELLSTMQTEKADFVTTDRLSSLNREAMTFSHIIGNWGLSFTTRILFGWPFNDSQSGMWIFKRVILNSLDVRSGGMPFSQELKVEAYIRGFKCIELPIEYRPRVGEVKLNTVKDGIRNITQLVSKRARLFTEYIYKRQKLSRRLS